MCHPLVKHETG